MKNKKYQKVNKKTNKKEDFWGNKEKKKTFVISIKIFN